MSRAQIPETIKAEGPHNPQLYLCTMPFNYSEHSSRLPDTFRASPRLHRRQVSLSRSIRGTQKRSSVSMHDYNQLKETDISPSRVDEPLPPVLPSLSDMHFGLNTTGLSRPHIPRPPNAFMLFRSDFLKRGVIPSHVERRQQNLSRIAGQCWNLLPMNEKEHWQEKAAKVLLEHQKQNPHYKFRPAPRGSRRTKSRCGADPLEDEDRIRKIREEYARIAGPTATPARRKRVSTQISGHKDKEATPDNPQYQITRSPLPSFIPDAPSLLSPGRASGQGPILPPFFPKYSVPHVASSRRSSNSLGFSTVSSQADNVSPQTGIHIARPLSATLSESRLSSFLRSLNITLTSTSFMDISNSSTPSISTLPMTPVDSEQHLLGILRDTLPFTSLNKCKPSMSEFMCPPLLRDEVLGNPRSLLNTLYSDDLDLPMASSCDSEQSMFGESYIPNTSEVSIPEEWELDHTYNI